MSSPMFVTGHFGRYGTCHNRHARHSHHDDSELYVGRSQAGVVADDEALIGGPA